MISDDFSVFWHNNERASALFYDLLARADQDAYDDDFLTQLAEYREAGGDAVHADIFAAQYLLANGDAENSVTCGERAFFYPRVREFLKGIASNGEAFPPPKESNA